MATTHAPPTFQNHSWSYPIDTPPVKSEKVIQLEEENEYNNWFNADEFPSLNNNVTTSSASSSPVSSPTSAYSPQQAQQFTNVFNLVSSSAMYTQPFPSNTSPSTTSTSSSSSNSSSLMPLANLNSLQSFPFCIGITPGSNQPMQVNGMNQGQTLNLISIPLVGANNQPNNATQMIPQMIVLPNFGFSQQQQLTVNPHFYSLMLTQFQSLQAPSSPSSSEESSEEPKKKTQKNTQRRIRQTRPKVVEAKGAVQCVGRNRKKNAQCRNAALMEYIGPRPVHCAEHIELDPNSLYEKCKSPYQKEVDDKKGCKEVVLKEFGLCYKHYGDSVAELVKNRDIQAAKRHFDRITDLLEQLEREAAAAKKKDGDLYQRKNKLIPKFQEMKKAITKGLEELQSSSEVDSTLVPMFPNIAPPSTAAESVDASYTPFVHANALTAGKSSIKELDSIRMQEHFS